MVTFKFKRVVTVKKNRELKLYWPFTYRPTVSQLDHGERVMSSLNGGWDKSLKMIHIFATCDSKNKSWFNWQINTLCIHISNLGNRTSRTYQAICLKYPIVYKLKMWILPFQVADSLILNFPRKTYELVRPQPCVFYQSTHDTGKGDVAVILTRESEPVYVSLAKKVTGSMKRKTPHSEYMRLSVPDLVVHTWGCWHADPRLVICRKKT